MVFLSATTLNLDSIDAFTSDSSTLTNVWSPLAPIHDAFLPVEGPIPLETEIKKSIRINSNHSVLVDLRHGSRRTIPQEFLPLHQDICDVSLIIRLIHPICHIVGRYTIRFLSRHKVSFTRKSAQLTFLIVSKSVNDALSRQNYGVIASGSDLADHVRDLYQMCSGNWLQVAGSKLTVLITAEGEHLTGER